jgi:hypothetical protein
VLAYSDEQRSPKGILIFCCGHTQIDLRRRDAAQKPTIHRYERRNLALFRSQPVKSGIERLWAINLINLPSNII